MLIRKVARIVTPALTPSLSLSINCVSFLKYLLYIYYKYFKIFPWKKFSQHVFVALWPIFENASPGKLNQSRNIVKTKLNNL